LMKRAPKAGREQLVAQNLDGSFEEDLVGTSQVHQVSAWIASGRCRARPDAGGRRVLRPVARAAAARPWVVAEYLQRRRRSRRRVRRPSEGRPHGQMRPRRAHGNSTRRPTQPSLGSCPSWRGGGHGRQPACVVSAGRVLAGDHRLDQPVVAPLRLYRTHSRSVSALTKMKKTWRVLHPRDGVSSNIGSMAKRWSGRCASDAPDPQGSQPRRPQRRGLAVKGRFAVVTIRLPLPASGRALPLGFSRSRRLAHRCGRSRCPGSLVLGPRPWLRRAGRRRRRHLHDLRVGAVCGAARSTARPTASDRSSRKRSSRRILGRRRTAHGIRDVDVLALDDVSRPTPQKQWARRRRLRADRWRESADPAGRPGPRRLMTLSLRVRAALEMRAPCRAEGRRDAPFALRR